MRPSDRRRKSRWALPLACCWMLGATAFGAHATEPMSDASSLSDSEIEKLLTRGRITRIVHLDLGVTDPQRVWIEHGGHQVSACFKSIDVKKRGITRLPGARPEINFTDRDAYDQAAYLLDRELGLHLVPVAVPRQIRGEDGTLILWIDDVLDEEERRRDDLKPPTPRELNHRLACMRVFDALIYNVDRNAGNILYSRADWSLHLIDHTRSFRTRKDLPDRFLRLRTTLPRPLYDRLLQLEEKRLQKLLKGLVEPGRIRALLVRRDLIVEKIEQDRKTWGDSVVFQLPEPAPEGE